MRSFFEYISTHWYWGAIIVLLLALTVFVWVKAISSSQKYREEREKFIANLEKEKALRQEFKVLDEAKFETTDHERLLMGITANIQMSIEKKEDLLEEYNALSEAKRYVYAIGYVFEDSKCESLSSFFSVNSRPLTSTANEAVSKIIGGKFSEIFSKMFAMTDDENETESYDAALIEKLDGEFKAYMAQSKEQVLSTIRDYIKSNKNEFLN